MYIVIYCCILFPISLERKLEGRNSIKKKPSTSEIIDWIQALVHGGVDPSRIVKEVPYLGVLLKKNEDMDAMRRTWR